jgi:hypothetical protein
MDLALVHRSRDFESGGAVGVELRRCILTPSRRVDDAAFPMPRFDADFDARTLLAHDWQQLGIV